MTLTDAAADYAAYLRHEQGASATTVRCYRNGLASFLRWMADNGYPDPALTDFNTMVLRKYLYELSGRGLRPRTLRGRFHPLRGIAVFLVKHGALADNPTERITLPKMDAAERVTVSDAEVMALMDACERLRDARRCALARAVIGTLCMAGLRRQECLDLHLSDFDPTEKTLLVRHGKNDKSRRLYLCDDLADAIREWKTYRPKDSRLDWMFMMDCRRRVGQDALTNLLEEVKNAAGLGGPQGRHILPHALRHNYATRLMQAGADLKSISCALGHADLRTTSIYLHADEARLKDIASLAAIGKNKTAEGNVIRLPQNRDRRFKRVATG